MTDTIAKGTPATGEREQAPGQAAIKLLVCLVAFVIAALPVALQPNLLLVDYPEHLAHFQITQNLATSAHLQEYYRQDPGFYPYWSIRTIVGALTPFIGAERAVFWFAVLAALMPAAGCCVLSWTLARRITLLPLIGLLFVYNDVFNWGFLNFLFSGGIALMVFAAWVGSQDRPFAARLFGLGVAAACLIWMHPLSAVLLGLLVCFWEAGRWIASLTAGARPLAGLVRLFIVGAAFLPAGFSLLALTDFRSSSTFLFGGDLTQRLMVIISPLWMTISPLNLFVGALGIAIILSLLHSRTLRLRDNFERVVIYLLVLALLAPVSAFGVFHASIRIPTFAVMVLVAALQPGEHFSARRMMVMPMFAVLLAAKLYGSHAALSVGSGIAGELRAAAGIVPEGSKVLMSVNYPAGPAKETDTAVPAVKVDYYLNLDSYLIVDRQALIPNIFGTVGTTYQLKYAQQVLPLGPPVPTRLLTAPAEDWSELDRHIAGVSRNWRRDFDYIVLIDFGAGTEPPSGARQVHRGSYFQILEVTGPQQN